MYLDLYMASLYDIIFDSVSRFVGIVSSSGVVKSSNIRGHNKNYSIN